MSKTCICPPSYEGTFKPENFTHIYTCKQGETITIRPAYKEDYDGILRMYDLYEPKESAQGLPPADPRRRKDLILRILNDSLSIVAEIEGFIAGHAGLIDIDPGIRSELLIVIHQNFQNRGIGSAMVELLLKLARHCRYHSIWMTVDVSNRKIIKVCRKHGFKFVGPFDSEREMELILE